jgi:hypothetical protein
MKKYKAFLLFSLIVATSLLIIGCGVLTSGTAAPKEVSGQSGELPVWLSLAHYEATATVSLEDEALDDDFFLGQSSDPSGSAETQTPVTQQAPTGTGTETTPTASEKSGSDEEKDSTPPEPGTMAYIIWQKEQREAAAEKAKEEREKADEKDKTLQERVWEMTHKSLSPSVDVEIQTPGTNQGQQGYEHMFDLN